MGHLRILLCAAAFLAPLSAQNTIDLEGRYWIPNMRSQIRVVAGGFGTDIDTNTDLGMADTNFPLGGVTLQHGRHRLRFTYTPIDYSGDNTVTRTIVFRGTPYTVGTRVVSDLEVNHLQLSWAYQFVRVADGRFRIGPMLEADGFLMHGQLAAPAFNVSQREDLSAGLPAAGLATDIEPVRWVDIYGEVAGVKMGRYGYYVGSDVGAKVRVKHLLLMAGYRTFNLHVEHSNDFAHMRLRGPFVGAGLTF